MECGSSQTRTASFLSCVRHPLPHRQPALEGRDICVQLPSGTWPAPVADGCTGALARVQDKFLLTDKATIVCRSLGDWAGGGGTHSLHPQKSLSHPLSLCLTAWRNVGCSRVPLQRAVGKSQEWQTVRCIQGPSPIALFCSHRRSEGTEPLRHRLKFIQLLMVICKTQPHELWS